MKNAQKKNYIMKRILKKSKYFTLKSKTLKKVWPL